MAKGKLTDKQRIFIQEYAIDHNATQAAIRAGYSEKTANEIGAQNLAKLSIKEAIQKLDQVQADKAGLSAIRTKEEIAKAAYANLSDRSVEQMRYSDKMAALKLACQIDALLTDKLEVASDIDIHVTIDGDD